MAPFSHKIYELSLFFFILLRKDFIIFCFTFNYFFLFFHFMFYTQWWKQCWLGKVLSLWYFRIVVILFKTVTFETYFLYLASRWAIHTNTSLFLYEEFIHILYVWFINKFTLLNLIMCIKWNSWISWIWQKCTNYVLFACSSWAILVWFWIT